MDTTAPLGGRPASKPNHAADADLARLGYKAELPRSLSMLSVLGLSFAIMAVPYGLSTTMYISLTDGQCVTVLYGWILVSLISLSIAASLAEICAVYPTAGGVYFWSARMATQEWSRIAAWVTGWMNLVGNWTVTLSINFGGAQLILSAISLWREDFVPNAWQTVLTFWAVMLVCFLINAFGSRYLDLINKVCIYWTAASVLILLVTLLSMARGGRRSGAFVFGHFDASESGWPAGWAFFVGLLQAAYTLTGYGLVASLCEEVQHPAREVPKAMVLSVAAAGITGIVYLLPVLFVLPEVKLLLTAANSQPIGLVFKTATGSAAGGFGLLFLILGIMLFAGTGALTASSRCAYAFARDVSTKSAALRRSSADHLSSTGRRARLSLVRNNQRASTDSSLGPGSIHSRRLLARPDLLRFHSRLQQLHRRGDHMPLMWLRPSHPRLGATGPPNGAALDVLIGQVRLCHQRHLSLLDLPRHRLILYACQSARHGIKHELCGGRVLRVI